MPHFLLAHPDQAGLTQQVAQALDLPVLPVETHHFPDGEFNVRVTLPVQDAFVWIVCSLNHPNEKLVWLYVLAHTLRDQGVKQVHLICPYLAYMRQDCAFHEGESVTVRYIATFLSSFLDSVVTIDPHLHRIHDLSALYTIPTTVLHARSLLAAWVNTHVKKPILIGPDSESEQWTATLATELGMPFEILKKERFGDHEVAVSSPHLSAFQGYTPLLVDDIISTGHTMIEALQQLAKTPLDPAVCIGIHGVFSGSAFEDLQASGCARIVTANTIPHPSNHIDVTPLLVAYLSPRL